MAEDLLLEAVEEELGEEFDNLLNENTEDLENLEDICQFIEGFNNGYLDATSMGQLDGGLSSDSEEEDFMIDMNRSAADRSGSGSARSTRFMGKKRVSVFNTKDPKPGKLELVFLLTKCCV